MNAKDWIGLFTLSTVLILLFKNPEGTKTVATGLAGALNSTLTTLQGGGTYAQQ